MLLYFRLLEVILKLFQTNIPYVILGCFLLFQPMLFSIILGYSTLNIINYFELF